jgi:hypothetical protein
MMIHAQAAHEERRSGHCIQFSSPIGCGVPLLVITRGKLAFGPRTLLLNTFQSLAVGLECAVLIFMAGQRLTMNVQVRVCDGLLAPYRESSGSRGSFPAASPALLPPPELH